MKNQEPYTIVIDTREKRPWSFAAGTSTVCACLPAGDYSIQGLETCVAIERKSLDDYVNTVVHNKKRFALELAKLKTYRFAKIVIEASIEDLLAGNYQSKAEPHSVLAITTALEITHHPVGVIFAGDRPHAVAYAESALRMAARYYLPLPATEGKAETVEVQSGTRI